MKALLLALAPFCVSVSSAQDLYDPSTLRTMDLNFHDTNWLSLLRQNYATGNLILADMTVEGTVYPDVGVRIRGHTSYLWLPTGSEKYSLAVDMDHTHPDQDLLGYNTLNLNNGHRDPTFCREVVYNNFVAEYIPNARSNHVLMTMGGQDWGVYVNVQQFNKDMLRDYFDDPDGMRVKCANNPNGPGLRYNGPNIGSYPDYDIKDDGGLGDPWSRLIACFYTVTFAPLSVWERVDQNFAIDPSIWSVVLENLFTDQDGYISKGADYTMYRNAQDGRFHLLQADGNETFTLPYWGIDQNFGWNERPLLSHLLSVPELRSRYMAHMRTALDDFSWNQLLPAFRDARNRIDAHVQADPKKIYSYSNFTNNFAGTVNLGGGQGGGNLEGLQNFVNERESFLRGHPEIQAPAPDIVWTGHDPMQPEASDDLYVRARVDDNVHSVASVHLYYLARHGSYQRIPMHDDGLNGDFAPGDQVYGVRLPVQATAGQEIRYYVAATASNSYGTVSFSPARTELAPVKVQYRFGSSGMRITEYLYSGNNGEFVELTNVSGSSIDMNGWSMDDRSGQAGTFDLSPAGVVAPGQTIVFTEEDPAVFSIAWGLSGVTVLGLNVDATLSRDDVINIFDAGGNLVERLAYGDRDFPGSIRAKQESGQICTQSLGGNNPFGANLAELGDPFGSYASSGGDLGSPGLHNYVDCTGLGAEYCNPAVTNSTGQAAQLTSFGSSFVDANNVTLVASDMPVGEFGLFLNGTTQGLVPGAGGGAGNLCLGGAFGRYNRSSQLFLTDSGGKARLSLNLAATPTPLGPTTVVAGQTWYFQAWFRDTPASTTNFTSALSVDFQ